MGAAICDNWKSQAVCEARNDGGCKCAWALGFPESCRRTDQCSGMGPTGEDQPYHVDPTHTITTTVGKDPIYIDPTGTITTTVGEDPIYIDPTHTITTTVGAETSTSATPPAADMSGVRRISNGTPVLIGSAWLLSAFFFSFRNSV